MMAGSEHASGETSLEELIGYAVPMVDLSFDHTDAIGSAGES